MRLVFVLLQAREGEQMEIVMRKTDELIPYVNNARKNDHAVDAVASSIKNYGFKQPIVIDGQGEVVAGHTRLKAAKKLGLKEVPVIVANDLTPAQVKAYRIADNRVGELAEWDMELLQLELADIEEFTGFEDLELPDEVEKGNDDDFDADAELEQIDEPITQRGWIYKLGNHRLMCGDSTSEEDVKRLVNGNEMDMILTDPPYGIDIVKKK
jgi:ParB-like chromosome segregation protein Spo0J